MDVWLTGIWRARRATSRIPGFVLLASGMFALVTGAGVAWAAPGVTRNLTAAPAIPPGGSVEVQNLVGHMTVSQGARFEVTAHVVANGDDAAGLAQSVRLETSTSGGRITVHVHYPVAQYRNLYVRNGSNGEHCILWVFCFHTNTDSNLVYQGEAVRVSQRGDEYVPPLHVDVAVTVPASLTAKLVNKVGLLEADGLTNTLELDAAGGDVRAHALTGNLTANTGGGALRITDLTGNLHAATGGGALNVQEIKGNFRAGTGGGAAYLKHGVGAVHLGTAGGAAEVNAATGPMTVATAGGDLDVAGYTGAGKLALHTAGGDARLSGDLAATHSLDITSGGGFVTLKVSHLSMHLDVSSGGGSISVKLPDATHVLSGDESWSADIGAASGTGHISSGGGGVAVGTKS